MSGTRDIIPSVNPSSGNITIYTSDLRPTISHRLYNISSLLKILVNVEAIYLLEALVVVDGVVTTDSAKELASSGCVGVTIGLKEVPGLRPEIEAIELKPGVGVVLIPDLK